ncbi:hypothetical protein J4E85_002942 [Alternaria conjuncta]|uniref:uncharacterized protein n=1 Tax=Alternaria conjuncta TaxID=181017 RepID=UPI0022202526|nr:uncharacterized protein J4E85_002942 [Alternaria conjuncta]KAI4932544.1 hypothetical protein J4E85_002942 [Alternaria conjuncta]
MAGRKRALEPAVDGGPATATSTRRKRARKKVVNDKSLLLKLPGELRNRIYEFIMEDVKEYKKGKTSKAPKRRGGGPSTKFDNDAPIRLKYTSVKSHKRFKTAKQWAAAHERRPYFGLTQACRMLREEFRPLYMSELGFCIDLHVGEYLLALGSNEEEQNIGQSIADIMRAPLSDDGADLLPFLKTLHGLKQPRLDKSCVFSRGRQCWDRDCVFAILCHSWQRDTDGLAEAKTGITKITFVKRPDCYNLSNGRPMLVLDLDSKFFMSRTRKVMDVHMRTLISRFDLGDLHTMITRFRCGGESFTYTTDAHSYWGDRLSRGVELVRD